MLGTPPFTSLQFSLGSGNPIYNITAVDTSTPTAIKLSLDRQYLEATAAATTYQIYRCYFAPPSPDFLRYVSVWDPTNGFTLWPKRPYWNRALLNIKDPLRSSQGQPVRIVPYKVDPVNGPMYEMWPAPTSPLAYSCNYERRGTDLALTDSLPAGIPEDLLMVKSKVKACEWAIMNTGRFPNLKGVDWRLMMTTFGNEYKELLATAKKQDEETFLQNYVIPRNRLYPQFPIDGRYLQSHDPN